MLLCSSCPTNQCSWIRERYCFVFLTMFIQQLPQWLM